MKQIIDNRYIKWYKFSSSIEAISFIKHQNIQRSLSLEDTFGDNHYCYVCFHSLTRKKQFIVSFSSDESEERLNFLFWNSLFVLDTGKKIYLIDGNLSIKALFEINLCLIGLYIINNNRLLILEEASYKIINLIGEVLKSESFDLIENFSIEDNLLLLQTSEDSRGIELN
jgi:hypothetical protein